MNIAVIGLGLIGGSICKAVKKYTDYKCYGLNRNPEVIAAALADKSIDKEITADNLNEADIVIICLYPKQIISFAAENINKFKKGSIVIDAGGIKTEICEELQPVFKDSGIDFIGAHPMAGREYSGYNHSQADLFKNASFIVTPYPETSVEKIKIIEDLIRQIGFGKFVITTPNEHDETIAYTSQLAHIVSNAYVKSPTIENKTGFSAGSFLDLTRVAKLNEEMWSSLMMLNREFLTVELKNIINNLTEYLVAFENNDKDYLFDLLRDGRIIKERSEQK
jgi:prephenate dehydrogenase